MKLKICAVLLGGVMIFSLCACGNSSNKDENNQGEIIDQAGDESLESIYDRFNGNGDFQETYSEGLEYTEVERVIGDGPNALKVTGIGSCTDTDIVIPSSIDGMSVMWIGASAFENNTEITSVTIPAGCGTLEENAFAGCSSLTSLTFLEPDSQYYVFHKHCLPQYDPADPMAWTINGEDPMVFMEEHDISNTTSDHVSVFSE